MWRRQAQARIAGRKGHLVLRLPEDMPEDFPPELVEQAAEVWAVSGRLPHPYELLYMPAGWVDAIVSFEHGVRFYEDFSKRPAKMF